MAVLKSVVPNMKASALSYARSGFAVFPVHYPQGKVCSCPKAGACTSPAKHPLTTNGFKAATTDVAQVAKWWDGHPLANIGIATGSVSKVVVLDVDSADEEELVSSMAGVATPRSGTGKGAHLYFAHPGGKMANQARIAGRSIDFRGDGGYVIAPPSLHISGKRYRWQQNRAPDDLPFAAMPTKLREWLGRGSGTQASSAAGIDGGVIAEGARNDTLFRIACALRDKGFPRQLADSMCSQTNEQLCIAPIEASEVTRLVASAYKHSPATDSPELPRATRAADVDDSNAVRWLVNGLLLREEPHLLVGPGGAGKSTVALELAAAVASGCAPFGLDGAKAVRGRVLYVSEEDSQEVLSNRLHALLGDRSIDVEKAMRRVSFLALKGFEFGNERWEQHVVEETLRLQAKLVVLDPIASMAPGDENSNSDAARVHKRVRRMIVDTGASVVLVHHVGKVKTDNIGGRKIDRARGASAWNAHARVILDVRPKARGISIECTKNSRARNHVPFNVELNVEEHPGNSALWKRARFRLIRVGSDSVGEAQQWILDRLEDSPGRITSALKKDVSGTGIRIPDFSSALKALESVGRIESKTVSGEHGAKHWYIRRTEEAA